MVLHRDATSLDGRVAVITGGGTGIGRAIVAAFAEFGARVSVWEKDEATAQSCANDAGALACVTDVRDPEQVDAALAATLQSLGTPSILVNNAGGAFASSLLETTAKGWDTLIRTNLTQVLLCTQRVAQAMVAAQQPGSIINVSTIEGTRAAPGYAAYAAGEVSSHDPDPACRARRRDRRRRSVSG
jgi:3-oxoacyl-[acyl-carrier protein] reductase